MDLTIKKEFAELLPKASPEERKLLEADCKEHGIEDPIKHNLRGEILDGMTRFEIAQKHHLEFRTQEIDLEDEDECRWYILTSQLARRNLSKESRDKLLAQLYTEKVRQVGRPRKKLCQSDSISEDRQDESQHRTSEDIAEMAGVSESTVHRATAAQRRKEEILEKLPKNIADHYRNGEKWSERQAESLLVHPRLGEIERALRTGQAKSIKEAVKIITGQDKLPKAPRKMDADDVDPEATKESGPKERMDAASRDIERHAKALKEWEETIISLATVDPWVSAKVDVIRAKVATILEALRSAKGKYVCKLCDGQGCATCKHVGWVDKITSDQME